jgi:Phosphotransferase enzyme family
LWLNTCRNSAAPDMIAADLLRALLHAYQLPPPTAIQQIHNGTNRVYRFDWHPAATHPSLAIKLSTRIGHDSPRAKQHEKQLLDTLGTRLNILPRQLSPQAEADDSQRFDWGMLYQQHTLATCFEWISAQPYRGLGQQLSMAGQGFARLQTELQHIDSTSHFADTVTTAERFHYRHNQLQLDETFCFENLQAMIQAVAVTHPATLVLQDNRDFLQQEMTKVAALVNQYCAAASPALQWVHLELSPSNIGYDARHEVNCIFDFESACRGLLLQDMGWHVATFCVDYRHPLAQVTTRLAVLLRAIQANLTLDSHWRSYLLAFMRLGYLDAIYRKLTRHERGVDTRLGFIKEDILCLRWLRQHQQQISRCIAQA